MNLLERDVTSRSWSRLVCSWMKNPLVALKPVLNGKLHLSDNCLIISAVESISENNYQYSPPWANEYTALRRSNQMMASLKEVSSKRIGRLHDHGRVGKGMKAF